MIRVSKNPQRYTVMSTVSTEFMSDKIFMKYAIADSKLTYFPKNTFKVVRLKTITGLDRDDFVKHLTSVKTDYLVYTFKRK